MPKPRATTELCRSVRAMPRLSLIYGCGKLRPKRIPMLSAKGGDSNPVNDSARAATKTIFARVGIDWQKEYQARGAQGQRARAYSRGFSGDAEAAGCEGCDGTGAFVRD